MIRPYDALGGLTPSEAHEQTEDYMDWRKQLQMQEARRERCESNRCNTCDDCPFRKEENEELKLSY